MKNLDLATVEFVIGCLTGQLTMPGGDVQKAGSSARALAERLEEVRASIKADLGEKERLRDLNAGTGIGLISRERQRQIDIEGWSAVHDDSHRHGELALAAALYATPILLFEQSRSAKAVTFRDSWPWSRDWDKRSYDGSALIPNGNVPLGSRKRHLEKAGALLAAELDRLIRIETKSASRAVGVR